MNIIILGSQKLDENFDTSWLATELRYPGQAFPVYLASLQICWEDVSYEENPTNLGTLNILLSNDAQTPSLYETITINTPSNAENAKMIFIENIAEFFKIQFQQNDTKSGLLTVIAYYKSLER